MLHVFSSFTGLPNSFFAGYAFSDADFISGTAGADDYFRSTGNSIHSGHDGCYLSIWKDNGFHRVGADYSGYGKIFYYCENGVWAFSNSIIDLADHLRQHGVSISADPVQLESVRYVKSSVCFQLACFDTFVEGVKLLPSYCEIAISGHSFEIVERSSRMVGNYEEELEGFISLWLRRMETLLSDQRVEISCDLTGGKDSRVVFGLVQRARERLGDDAVANTYYRSGTKEMWRKDLLVAEQIAKTFDVRLNERVKLKKKTRRLIGAGAYSVWKSLNLGIYYAVYFPSSSNPFTIKLGGAGGENHRPFYRLNTFEDFVSRVDRTVRTPNFEDWLSTLEQTLEVLTRKTPDVPPWILHYREFRNRMHGGRTPQYSTVVAPLASKEMSELSNFEGKYLNSQVHFDIMENLFTGLAELPYDDPAKGPSRETMEKITMVSIPKQAEPGKAYISCETEVYGEASDRSKPLDYFIDEFRHASNMEVAAFMPEIAQEAHEQATKASENGSFQHAFHGACVTRMLTANYAYSLG